MLRTVLPLIARNKLPIRPSKFVQVMMGQRALMYPANPVSSRSPVCKLFTSGQYDLTFLFQQLKPMDINE